MVKNKDAWAPFSTGPFGCRLRQRLELSQRHVLIIILLCVGIGKNLAMIELRTVTTKLVLRFDVSLASGEDGTRLLYKTKDHFTVDSGQLDLVFKEV